MTDGPIVIFRILEVRRIWHLLLKSVFLFLSVGLFSLANWVVFQMVQNPLHKLNHVNLVHQFFSPSCLMIWFDTWFSKNASSTSMRNSNTLDARQRYRHVDFYNILSLLLYFGLLSQCVVVLILSDALSHQIFRECKDRFLISSSGNFWSFLWFCTLTKMDVNNEDFQQIY